MGAASGASSLEPIGQAPKEEACVWIKKPRQSFPLRRVAARRDLRSTILNLWEAPWPQVEGVLHRADGVSIEDCEEFSRGYSLLLDQKEFIPGGHYELEVSPGAGIRRSGILRGR